MWNSLINAISRLIRPAFTFSLLYWDYVYLVPVADANLSWTQPQEQSLFVLNLLILGFWFGERFFKNALPVVVPMMSSMFGAKSGQAKTTA